MPTRAKRFSHFYRMGRGARRNDLPLDSSKLTGEPLNAWKCGWYEQDMDFYHESQGPCDGLPNEVDD
jgi:hypothetical protein